MLIYVAIVQIFVAILSIAYADSSLFLVTRIINGTSLGFYLTIPPVFGYEITPNEIKGRNG